MASTKVKRTAEGGAFYVPCAGPKGDGKGCPTKSGKAIAHATPVGLKPRCKKCQRLSDQADAYLGYLQSKDDPEKLALLGTLWDQRKVQSDAGKAERAAARKASKGQTVARKAQRTTKAVTTGKATPKVKRPTAKTA